MLDLLQTQLLLLVEPIGLVWACLLVLSFLAWRRGVRWVGRSAGALALLLYVMGSTGVAPWLLHRLERPFVGVDYHTLPPADAIVILGGGLSPSLYEAGGVHLTSAGDRDFMAMELLRLHKAPVLVLGGGGGKIDGRDVAESVLFKKWLEESHLGAAEILALGIMANTHDEAVHVRKLADERGWKDMVLVTSANHLPRSIATFAAAGVKVRPLGCNFLTAHGSHNHSQGPPVWLIPSWPNFELFSVWLHETAGWYEYRRRGWIE